MSDLIYIVLLATIGSIAGLIGGVVLIIKSSWGNALCKYAIPFAAGVLLSVSILHLIPEAHHEMGEGAFLIVLLAFLGSFLFEQFFAHLHHHEDRKHTMLKTAVPLVIFGDTIHNFIDGTAIAAAYLADPVFGLVVALATFMHETPHEIGDFGLLMKAGWSKGKTFAANFFSASFTFPGAFFVYYFAREDTGKIGFLLAVSAGIFLFLGASDFLPEVEEEERKHPSWAYLAPLFVGVAVMYLMTLIVPEHH